MLVIAMQIMPVRYGNGSCIVTSWYFAQDELVADIHRGVSNLSADNMEQVLEKAILQKTECQKVRKRLAEERMVLSEYSKDIGRVGDKQYIILVSQVCGDSQGGVTSIEHSLDTDCSVVMSQWCYDVTDWEGKMLVGWDGGFDVVDSRVSPDTSERGGQSRSHRVLKSVSTADSGNINSIQYYNNQIYTLCKEVGSGTKRLVIVFDSKYSEVRRWSVPDYKFISQLAVCNNKVYVSDTDNKQLCVYSATSGTLLSILSNPLFVSPNYLNICPPHSLLISDYHANRVHRLNCRSDTITWTSAVVKNPRGIALDHTRREVLVCSRATKSLFILNSDTGEFKQEIHHKKFTQLPDGDHLIGMCLVDGELWGAARSSGLLKFTVK
ncbi:hypothetical protein EB796_006707 [Bugula neritina]|uniref:Uncharacterized protein n=1 Tax=Bugula neritina TaxID=10212 RepID=A0A7J7K9X8_BUGNE|nr:hypothetical protein EB796_006707 [Bugula neritina]